MADPRADSPRTDGIGDLPARSWEADVVLADGGTVHVRPIESADAQRYRSFHSGLSSESLYYRFFSPKPRLTEAEVVRFTTVDMTDRVALVALLGDEIVADARYDRWLGKDEAEVAFMVADELQGRGLSTLLLEHLAAIARLNGIARFTAEVLADNRAMLAVFARAGWPMTAGAGQRHRRRRVRHRPDARLPEHRRAPGAAGGEPVHRSTAAAQVRCCGRCLGPARLGGVGADAEPHEQWLRRTGVRGQPRARAGGQHAVPSQPSRGARRRGVGHRRRAAEPGGAGSRRRDREARPRARHRDRRSPRGRPKATSRRSGASSAGLAATG